MNPVVHHPDCDGWMTAHRVEIVGEPTETKTLWKAVCVECGVLHAGSFGNRADAERLYGSHAQEVPCDLRCRSWPRATITI